MPQEPVQFCRALRLADPGPNTFLRDEVPARGRSSRPVHVRSGRDLETSALSGSFRSVKTTAYFEAVRKRPDRAVILDDWIERAMSSPIREQFQADGRIRRWIQIPEAGGRFLRVVLLPDGETIHNAFFDRGFVP